MAIFTKGVDQEAMYFDSLALPINNVIKDSFLCAFPKIKRNKHPYQSFTSNYCAHYAICFIHYLSTGYSFEQFLNVLDKCNNSDLFVKIFVNKMIGK